jgi:hypothetical protein
MRLIEATPAPCINCGRGNGDSNDGDRPRFVDLERDVNWNEPVIFCEDCIMKLGGLIGMLGEDTRKELLREVRKAHQELHDVQAEMDKMRRRAARLGVEFTGKKSIA